MNDQQDHDNLGADLKSAVTGWSPNRRRFLSVAGLAVGGAVVGTTAAGCGTAQTGNSSGGSTDSKGRAGAAGETLFVAGLEVRLHGDDGRADHGRRGVPVAFPRFHQYAGAGRARRNLGLAVP